MMMIAFLRTGNWLKAPTDDDFYRLRFLSSLDHLVRLDNFWKPLHHVQPPLDFGVLIQTQTSIPILTDPRLKVQVHHAVILPRNDTPALMRFQLNLQHPKTPVGLSFIPLVRIIILDCIIMAEPITLPNHRPHGTDQKASPLINLHSAGLAGRTKFVIGVIVPEKVVDASHAFPAGNVGVWVLESGDTAIGVDGEELRALDAVGVGGEGPESDIVREVKCFKDSGHFVRVWSCCMGVENQGFYGVIRHGS